MLGLIRLHMTETQFKHAYSKRIYRKGYGLIGLVWIQCPPLDLFSQRVEVSIKAM